MFKGLFLTLGTKYERTIDGNYIFVKTERDTSFRQVIVTWDLPAQFHHSNNSEIMKISVRYQHPKKVVSDSLRLVDFAIGLVNFVLNLSDKLTCLQVTFGEEFK